VSDSLPERAFIERATAALVRQQERERRGGGNVERERNGRPRSTLISRRGDEITPEPIDWLWPGRIARGKLTVIAGHPGTGKSQVISAIVATVTRAAQWPVDRTRAPEGSAVILSAEDDAANTIIPRLIAAGADVSRVHIVEAVRAIAADGTPGIRGVDLGRDIAALETLVEFIGDVVLIVIDPITAYLGRTDSHINAEVRGLLMPLTQLAGLYGVAIIAVTHLRKSAGSEALLAVSGSLGFVAASRAAYLVVKDPSDPTRQLWLPVKNNLGADLPGLAYRIVPYEIANGIATSRVEWDTESVTITADGALGTRSDHDELRIERDAAAEWLRELLSTGPVAAREVQAEAKSAGHSWATVRRAKDVIGVQVKRDGFGQGGAWRWSLPAIAAHGIDALGAGRKSMSAYEFNGDGEHLCDPIDAHSESIECIGAQLFAPEHVCARCNGEGCRWCKA
jgi:hypothetical protein